MLQAVRAARPQIVIHELTDLPKTLAGSPSVKRFTRTLAGAMKEHESSSTPRSRPGRTWNTVQIGRMPVHVDAAARAALLAIDRAASSVEAAGTALQRSASRTGSRRRNQAAEVCQHNTDTRSPFLSWCSRLDPTYHRSWRIG
jgi:hypothetical protein